MQPIMVNLIEWKNCYPRGQELVIEIRWVKLLYIVIQVTFIIIDISVVVVDDDDADDYVYC